jgi:CelD/BcsL family acetyltransferase involved in cellulose biosynthesis
LDVANAFAEKGWLSLFFLTFNDEPVSSFYCFEYNKKLYFYLSGFDPEYAYYRPGHLTFKYIIKYGIEKGLNEFDFLRGNETYKSL